MPKVKEKQEEGAQVSIRGTPREIQEASADMVEAARESAKRIAGEDNGKTKKQAQDINELLQYAEYRCRATRRVPAPGTMAFNPQTRRPARLISSMEVALPTTMAEIEEELRQGPGGKVWHIEVMDDRGKRISGARINIDTPPGAVFDDTVGGVPIMTTPVGMSPWDPTANPYLAQSLTEDDEDEEQEKREERDFRRKKRDLELEEARERAEERRMEREARRSGMNSDAAAAISELKSEVGQLREKVSSMQERLRDFKHEKEMGEAREKAEVDRRISELKSALDRSNSDFQRGLSDFKSQLAAGSADKGVLAAITDLQKSQSEASAKVQAAMIGALTAKAEASATDPIEKFVSAFSMMSQAMGVGGFAPSDDPVTTGIKGINDGIKEFLDYKRSQGEAMSEERIQEEIEKAKRELLTNPEIAAAIAENVRGVLMKGEKKKLPPQKKKDAQEPAKPPAKAEPNPVEQQFRARINEWMKVILAEIDVMPGNAQLIDFALDHLPRKFLKELVAVVDQPLEAAKLIAPHVEEDILKQFSEKLMGDEEKRDWLAQQLATMADEFNAILAEEQQESGQKGAEKKE